MFFQLILYPTETSDAPAPAQLQAEIAAFKATARAAGLDTDDEEFRVCEPIWRDACCCLHLSGRSSRVLELVLDLLSFRGRNACLLESGRPVLTQKSGQLRLDVERFWTPALLEIVQRRRAFERARILYDFPESGFFREEFPDPPWERSLKQALVNVQGGLGNLLPGYSSEVLNEFYRLTNCRMRLPETVPPEWSQLTAFLQDAAPDLYPRRPVLPAVFIGGPPLIAERPPWIHFFWHQFHGHMCGFSHFSGVLLPLPMNCKLAVQDPGPVLDGLEALAEDPDRRVLSTYYPQLARLLHNREHFSAEELEVVYQFVSRSYRIPRFASGVEALLEFVDCEPLEWFQGWLMVHEDGSGTELNADTYSRLREWYDAELRCFFLWNNSD